jgi:hypothetical protein
VVLAAAAAWLTLVASLSSQALSFEAASINQANMNLWAGEKAVPVREQSKQSNEEHVDTLSWRVL